MHVVYGVVVPLFAGMTPERPLWLRRIVQAFWVLVVLAVFATWIYGVYRLIGALM